MSEFKTKQHATGTPADWVARARELTPMIEAASDRIERERQVTAEVMAALHDARLFHMLLPREMGGGEADPVAFMEVIEAVSAGDASVGRPTPAVARREPQRRRTGRRQIADAGPRGSRRAPVGGMSAAAVVRGGTPVSDPA